MASNVTPSRGLLAANEANLLVRWLLVRLQIKPGAGSVSGGIDASEFNRGRVIGLLERVLIYAFVLNGQYGAIGFTPPTWLGSSVAGAKA